MKRIFAAGVVCAALAMVAPAAHATCRVLDVTFTPTDKLQIAVWLEDANGTFIDTLFITDDTGRYGLGNRPGMEDFNSALLWPYGRRESTLPIWAHRRGITYPRLVFQDHNDMDLSHPANQGTPEPHYCRPMTTAEADMGTCATALPGTDKGKFPVDGGPLSHSYYPPRGDLATTSDPSGFDAPEVATYAVLNDLDAVSQATPPGGMPFTLQVSIPMDLPDGDYVVWVETGKEFDQNATYAFPSPTGIPLASYGAANRGQPSVVWKVPVTIDATTRTVSSLDYAGYGDPAGATGDVNLPDATITADVEGSGAQRLLIASGPQGMNRVTVTTLRGDDSTAPDAPGGFAAGTVTPDGATLSFTAPGDPQATGMVPVTAYEIRYRAGAPLDATNFTDGARFAATFPILSPGMTQTFEITGLAAQTHYYVGVRALDGCLNPGAVAFADFVTPKPPTGSVDACFVATAAWGSPMQDEVSMLRRFRDQALRSQAVGELFVEAYYTFGPALAATIEPSDTLRGLARTALGPAVDLARVIVR